VRKIVGPTLLLSAFLILGCAPQGAPQEIEFRVPVVAGEVGTGTVEDTVVATGTLRATESIALRADTAGALYIARSKGGIRLSEGDHVEPGQSSAEIPGEAVRLAARREATSQRYDAALREYESKKKLYDDGLLSEQEFRQVTTSLTDARVDRDQSLLTENRSRLLTPIAGVVLSLARDSQGRPLADGQLVSQGTEVAQIGPIGTLIAEVDLVGPDVARVTKDLKARVRYHAWEEDAFSGTVMRLAPSLDPVTRTLRADVAVDNLSGLLRPGMFVEVTMIVERREDVPVIPRDALADRAGRKVAFVIDGQRVSQRDLVLGLGNDEFVEVRSGLEVGDRVVVRGWETLVDESRVQVTGG
jgi:RND family efflux transporter MFP subunit